MKALDQKVKGIRKMMEDKKSETYALVNPDLVSLDEYMKTLYLKVMCTLVQYENDPADMQILYLKRIISGIGAEESAEEYMKKALEISDTDIQEFLTFMKQSKIKYYVALDGLLLVSMGNPRQENYEYLAEIIELMGVNKEELEYLCLVAKSVLQQQSSYYDEAKTKITEGTSSIDFTPYIQNYYAGAIVDSDEVIHYSAPNLKASQGINYPKEYKQRTVIFENMDIPLKADWNFQGCREVVFKNCNLTGGEHQITFHSIEKLTIDYCKISGFTNCFAKLDSVNQLYVSNSKFRECGVENDKEAGVFSSKKCGSCSFDNNRFNNCYNCYSHYYNTRYGTKLLYLRCEKLRLVGNEFAGYDSNGNSIVYFSQYDPVSGNYHYVSEEKFGDYVEERDNKYTGKLLILISY